MIVIPLIVAALFAAQAVYLVTEPGGYAGVVAAYSNLVGTSGATSAAFVLGIAGSITTRLLDRSSSVLLLRNFGRLFQHRGRRALNGISSSIHHEFLPHAAPLGIAAVAHVVSQPMETYVDFASLYVKNAGAYGWDWTYPTWSMEQTHWMKRVEFLDGPIRNDTCLPAHRQDTTDIICERRSSDAPLDIYASSVRHFHYSVFLGGSDTAPNALQAWFHVSALYQRIRLSVLTIGFVVVIAVTQLVFPPRLDWLKLPVPPQSDLPTHWIVPQESAEDNGEEPGLWALIPKPPMSPLWTVTGATHDSEPEVETLTLDLELSLFAVENRLLLVDSGGETDMDIDEDTMVDVSDGTLEDEDNNFSACPIYAADCGDFPDTSSDMSLDIDCEDLDCADMEYPAGCTVLDIENWAFTFAFDFSKASDMGDLQRPKILRRSLGSLGTYPGRFGSGPSTRVYDSSPNVAIPSAKRRRLDKPGQERVDEAGR